MLKKRKKGTHKRDYGNVFVIAGSRGFTGAGALCSQACLRAGAGLVTLGIPQSLNPIMEVKLTEVMTCPLPETKAMTLSLKAEKPILEKINKSDVVVLGPGNSCNPETIRLIRKIIVQINKPMVMDADALNAISKDVSILKRVQAPYIITPHLGEMSRLISKDVSYIKENKVKVAKKFATDYKALVVLKGYRTVVADVGSKKCYINKTGNPGMATAGSGDVLTGVIAGFLAQGLSLSDSAKLGVYIHGLAGDIAKKDKGEIGMIASDILEKIPFAIKWADTRVAKGVRL